jgi:hypothetical protein
MPKIKIDYSNTIFYKICCKDVADLYIGHTTNFVQRKHSHKQGCTNIKSSTYNCKLYTFIRNNGGWDNWHMEIIAFHECNDLMSAKKYEQYYFEKYNATLNSIEPLPTSYYKCNKNTNVVLQDENKQSLYCNVCNVYFSSTHAQHVHNQSNKHAKTIEKNSDIIIANKAKQYNCIKCDFVCSKQSDWSRHVMTIKHQHGDKMVTNGDNLTPNNANYVYICGCGSAYKYRQGLSRHKKICSGHQGNTVIQNNLIQNTSTVSNVINSSNEIDKELLIKLLLKNQDVMEKMMEIMPSIGNHSHNTTNSHNTQNFNIQMFLNEQCKNAMNLTDFIDTLPITAETYDNTIENGLTKTITTMITNGLSQLDILERPIHCTDATRKTIYVKEANIWEKDTELLKLLFGIKNLARKQRTMISKWKDVNDGWEDDDNIQTKLTTLICHSMTDIENDEKETGKIIRAIGKTTYLSNQIKNELTLLKD